MINVVQVPEPARTFLPTSIVAPIQDAGFHSMGAKKDGPHFFLNLPNQEFSAIYCDIKDLYEVSTFVAMCDFGQETNVYKTLLRYNAAFPDTRARFGLDQDSGAIHAITHVHAAAANTHAFQDAVRQLLRQSANWRICIENGDFGDDHAPAANIQPQHVIHA